jgi:hypothetical protein
MNVIIKGGRHVGFYSTILCLMATIYHCRKKQPSSKFIIDNNALHYGDWSVFFEPIHEFNTVPDIVLQDTQAWYHYIKTDTPPDDDFINKLSEFALPYLKYSNRFLEFFNSFPPIDNYVTIHFRGAGGTLHNNPHVLEDVYVSVIREKYNNTNNILVCTDDSDAVSNLIKLLPDKNIIHHPTYTRPGGEVHIFNSPNNKSLLGFEVMRDSLLMSKSNAIIGKGSNVSSFAKVLNNNVPIYYVG